MRKILFVLTALGLLGILTACNRGPQADGGQPTVALVLKTLNNPYFTQKAFSKFTLLIS